MATTTNSKFAFLEYALILLTLPFVFVFVFFQAEAVPESTTSLIPISGLIHPLVGKMLAFFSFLASLWVMSTINRQYKFAEYSNRSIFALGLLFALLFPDFFLLLEDGLALLCMSLVLYFLLQIHNQKTLGALLFSAAFFLSLATLLNNSTFWFLIFLFAALFILRPFKLKEHLSILTAYLLPFCYLYAFAFVFDWEVKTIDFGFNVGFRGVGAIAIQIAYAWLIVLSLASIFYSLSSRSKMIVRSRKQMTVLLLFFFSAVLMAFLTNHLDFDLFLMMLPISIFYALFHKRLPRRWIVDVLSILIAVLVILYRFDINFFG